MPGRVIEAVLFDLDGTLLDSVEAMFLSFERSLSAHLDGPLPRREVLRSRIGRRTPAVMLEFAGGDAARAERLVAAYRETHAALLPELQLYDGAKETLKALASRGLRLGVVTSKNGAMTHRVLQDHGLAPLLEIVLSADDTPQHKPDPLPLQMAAERLGIAPTVVAYVGDSVFDVRCARAAACLPLGAAWGIATAAELQAEGARHVMAHVSALLALPELSAGGS